MQTEVNGLRIGYETMGQGESVLLLHGWGGTRDSLRPLIHCLSRSFHVISLDLPGFGDSTQPTTTWGDHDYAQCLAAFLAAIDCAHTHIVGHSFGGRVAICLAADCPSLVDRLVLMANSGIRAPRTLRYHVRVRSMKIARQALQQIPVPGARARALAWLYRSMGSNDYRDAGAMRSILVRAVNEDLRPVLPSVRAPSLLIWGDQDFDVPVAHAEMMAQAIPGARLEVLRGAGHFVYMDRLPQCCQLIRDFLKES